MIVMRVLLLIFLVHASLPIVAQLPDIVQTEGIKTEVHKNNIGKIFFATRSISSKNLNETDFLKTYTLSHKSNLFVIAFMDNSLTNYLHRMQPGLKADSLVRIGNYQFA